MSAPDHPSHYALDRAVASEDPGLGGLAAHVAACAECAAHVRAIQERRAMPDRLAALAASPRPSRGRWTWLAGAAVAVAAALAVVAVLVRAPAAGPPGTYVASKGGPGALLFVKRGERVFPWAPPERVQPGDLLRLEVMPDGFSYLTVATPGAGGWTVLFQGDVPPEREFDLPSSWRVDAAGSAEDLLVVFSRQKLRPELLPDLASRRPRTGEVWTTLLEIEKIGGR